MIVGSGLLALIVVVLLCLLIIGRVSLRDAVVVLLFILILFWVFGRNL